MPLIALRHNGRPAVRIQIDADSVAIGSSAGQPMATAFAGYIEGDRARRIAHDQGLHLLLTDALIEDAQSGGANVSLVIGGSRADYRISIPPSGPGFDGSKGWLTDREGERIPLSTPIFKLLDRVQLVALGISARDEVARRRPAASA